ncbi:MAG TPA: ABC transporter ATP-binding protein [Candidatus Limnocylindrales bacterium]|nr:ABC transporter ATP-binding protein [Candidatus Limnocylindrales bacterium]
MTDPLLEIRGLNVYYGLAHAVQDVDLEVNGHSLSLIGRNGMGKTTLCNALLGLIPSSGTIRLNGEDLQGRAPHEIGRAGIGYVPQGRRLFPSLSVEEHLRLVAQGNGAGWTIPRVWDLFPPLAQRRRHGAAELSGGEQQMLAIARALLLNPRLLVMDEPSEGLAPIVIEQLVSVLRDVTRERVGLLLVEQNLGVATSVSEQIAVMVTGRIALQTTSQALLADVSAQRRYLGVSVQAGAGHS